MILKNRRAAINCGSSISKIAILLRMNSLYRANICASTTVGAYIRIDFINVAFRYRFNRALINACSASSAIIINFVSHFYLFLIGKLKLIDKIT
jgi:hypothetical protein